MEQRKFEDCVNVLPVPCVCVCVPDPLANFRLAGPS